MQPPEHLSEDAAKWFASVTSEFDLEEHHIKLLTLAAESWDRCQQARAAIAEHGICYQDRFGAPKTRPEIAVERDSRLAFARLLRELCLDLEPPAEAPRPPAAILAPTHKVS